MAARKTILAFFAHPDDAEILCAGTLVRLAEAGWDVHLATATAGDCGTVRHSSEAISRIRKAEAIASAKLIGAHYHCLEFLDGRVTYEVAALQRCFDLFRQVNPSLVFTHPARDYMMDHEMVHKLARAASFVFAARNISNVPIVGESGVPHLYYCDPIGGTDELGSTVTPTTLINIAASQERKLQMLACHDSQREWLRVHHGMDEYIEATRRHDAERGRLIGSSAAEAFIQHRGHAYPANDILLDILG